MADTVVSIKVLPFSGKTIDWPVWSVKFLARAESKGYLDLLTGDEVSPTDSEQPDSTATADEIKKFEELRQANKQGFIDLVLSVGNTSREGRIAFSIIKSCRNGDKKPGDVAQAWERLSEKFEPKSAQSRINLRRLITSMKMEPKQDPVEWLTSLEDIREQLINAGSSMSDEELLEHVFANVPKDYEVISAPLEKRLGSKFNPVTIDEVRDDFNLRYQRLYGTKKTLTTQDESETALYAGGFRGKCNECGKMGHKARDCREKQGKSSNRNNRQSKKKFNGVCNYCKKKGHMEKDCWKKKREENNKGSENASVAKEKDDDVVLIAMDAFDAMSHDEIEEDMDAYYMDDDFFDHFSSDDDFSSVEYDETNVLDVKTFQTETTEPNVVDKWTVVTDNKEGGQSLLEKEESKQSNKEDDVIEEFFNSQGDHFYEASPTFAYQDKEFSTHLMEACLRIHKKANKTNKTVSEEQEEDYDIAELFRREEEELGLVTTEVSPDVADGEIQGPMP
jgi:hypothetical protein